MQTDFLVLQDGNELSSKGFGKEKEKIGKEESKGEDSGFLSTMIGIADEQAASPSRSSQQPDPKEAKADPSSRGKSRPENELGPKGDDTSRVRTNSLEIAQVLRNGKAQDQSSEPLKLVHPEKTKLTAPGLDRGNQAPLELKETSKKSSMVSNRFGIKEAENATGEARDRKTEKGPLDEARDLKEPAPARTANRSRGKTAKIKIATSINIDAGRAEGRGDDRGGVKGPLDAKTNLKELAPARAADRSRGKDANTNIDTRWAEGRGNDRGGVKGPLDETRNLKEHAPARMEAQSRGKTTKIKIDTSINIDAGRAEGRGDDRGGVKGPLDAKTNLKELAPARAADRSRGKDANINIDAGKAGLMTSRKGGPTEKISLKEGRGGSKPELFFDQDRVHSNRDKKGLPLRYVAYLSRENNRSDYIEKGVPARVPSQGPVNLSNDLQAITLKAKSHTGDSHRRVDKAETSSGENSFLSSNSHSSADKTSGTILHAKGPETARRAFQNDGLKQIVEKASLAIKNSQPEITINLKPEFLGHVKIRITTENHLVSVKIMAEIPLVKEMIETNLNQLKADIQDHGLEVDQLDVSLAPDSGKDWAGDEKAEFQKKKEETGGKDRSDQRSLEKGEEMMRSGGEYGETGVVNYFA